MTSNRLALVAPLPGWVLPLEEAPEPVFAGGMAGVGVAIDPTVDTLHAPCAGEDGPGPRLRTRAGAARADNAPNIPLDHRNAQSPDV